MAYRDPQNRKAREQDRSRSSERHLVTREFRKQRHSAALAEGAFSPPGRPLSSGTPRRRRTAVTDCQIARAEQVLRSCNSKRAFGPPISRGSEASLLVDPNVCRITSERFSPARHAAD